jgi:hypothetical protein
VFDELRRRADGWPALDDTTRELDARPMAERLYHAVAASLLLAEGQHLAARGGGARKLLAAGLYARRWLAPPSGGPVFSGAALGWLDALVDWPDVPGRALADVQ